MLNIKTKLLHLFLKCIYWCLNTITKFYVYSRHAYKIKEKHVLFNSHMFYITLFMSNYFMLSSF